MGVTRGHVLSQATYVYAQFNLISIQCHYLAFISFKYTEILGFICLAYTNDYAHVEGVCVCVRI